MTFIKALFASKILTPTSWHKHFAIVNLKKTYFYTICLVRNNTSNNKLILKRAFEIPLTHLCDRNMR